MTEKLEVVDKEKVDPNITTIEIASADEKEIDQKAEEYVSRLIDVSMEDLEKQKKQQTSVERMGAEVQIDTSKRLKLLDNPLKQMAKSGEDGGVVAKSLIDLKMEVEKLNPNGVNLEAGWFSRIIGMIPGVGTPLQRYFSKFESAQTVIATIIDSLHAGKDELKRDNITLAEDQKFLHASAMNLKKLVSLGQKMDEKLVYKADREFAEQPERKKFIEEKLIFPLRQRVIDFQQQMAVVQQGIVSIEIIQRNNKELIRGVERSLNVTVNALQVAATVAMALNNQKIVMDKISMINTTTDNLISGTAQQLKTQGVEIQKQASSAQLNIESLKQAFVDISGALDDLSNFRQEALPKMAQTILEMDQVSADAEKKIQEIEEGKQFEENIEIELKI